MPENHLMLANKILACKQLDPEQDASACRAQRFDVQDRQSLLSSAVLLEEHAAVGPSLERSLWAINMLCGCSSRTCVEFLTRLSCSSSLLIQIISTG